ncbi:hypothetical protein A7C91_09580 [Thermococcus piezophilus]|uniref:Uncharacterized protein n=1 Tax=Thermococcus piezophilus TaxID=1712654 RepID=A0A172WIU4_9EURY|nr:hypothetical protein A7C91_09580 [Thermococcus piezophilus]
MNRGAMRGLQLGLSEVPPGAFRVTERNDRGKPRPSTAKAAWVSPPESAVRHRWGWELRAGHSMNICVLCKLTNVRNMQGLNTQPEDFDRKIQEIIPWARPNR